MDRSSLANKQLLFSYREYRANKEGIPKGTEIEDYKVIRQIGKGAFGKIYLAQNSNKESFALKLMDLEQIKKESNPKIKQIRSRLVKNEPKLMQQCNSPNVLKCYDIFENESLKVLVLEYCNGKTLQHYIDRKIRISENEAVKILRQIINGIAELHNHSIIHRDLKADNIMEHEGEYKIIDLGFSKKLQIQNELAEVKGTTLGTVTTMAPQVLSKSSYGLKADIWSIGVIFFQMVFGTLLYDSVSVRHRLKQIENKSYFSPDKELTFNGVTISKDANNFLYRVLEVNTEKRMGWRQLLEHPLIKYKEQQLIGQHFLIKRDLQSPAGLNLKGELTQIQRDNQLQNQIDKYQKLNQSIKSPIKIPPSQRKQEIKQEKNEDKETPSRQNKFPQLKSNIGLIGVHSHIIQNLNQTMANMFNLSETIKQKEKTSEQGNSPNEKRTVFNRQAFQQKEDRNEKANIRDRDNVEEIPIEMQNKSPQVNKNQFKIDVNFHTNIKSNREQQQYRLREQESLFKNSYQRENNFKRKQQQIPQNNWRNSYNTNQIPNFANLIPRRSYNDDSFIKDSEEYKWTKEAHLECLKSELIYHQLITPIERKGLLDLDERVNIQFMYLLSARCFNNISFIKIKINQQKKGRNTLMKNLYEQVQSLYQKGRQKFEQYSTKLTTIQNNFSEQFFDFFRKRFSKQDYNEKGSITSGIECASGEHKSYGDYSRNQQIQYTYNHYIHVILNSLKAGSPKKVCEYLRYYDKIMKMTMDSLDGESFLEYVEGFIN